MRTAEEILSKHTGAEGIYLEKGQHYGKDVLDAMREYAEERASELMQGVNQLQNDLSNDSLSHVRLSLPDPTEISQSANDMYSDGQSVLAFEAGALWVKINVMKALNRSEA